MRYLIATAALVGLYALVVYHLHGASALLEYGIVFAWIIGAGALCSLDSVPWARCRSFFGRCRRPAPRGPATLTAPEGQ